MAYIGSAEDARRIRKQEEQREQQRKEFEERKQRGESNVDSAGLRQFGAGRAEVLEAAFKNETVGLVTREEFLSKRNTIKDRLQEEEEKRKRAAEEEAAARKAERQRKKARTQAKSKLSFLEDEDLQEEEEGDDQADKEGNGKAAALLRIGKNPDAETSFLPDRDRDKREQEVKQQLEQEYDLREEALKGEPLDVEYSFFDGSGHRRSLTVRRGDSVGEFLKKAREQLGTDFKEIRNISLSNLMYVKEDMILPHAVTFHELIKKRLRGKTGPLFEFGEHHDVRAFSDSRIQQRSDVHAGRVVTRNFYDRNKHIFPASKWEVLKLDGPEDS